MKLAISKLSISNFRTFKGLTIGGLGRVNLITGRNNTGKSSVLEAIRILTSDGSQFVLDDILRKREEYSVEANYTERLADGERLFEMSALFSGFPNLSSKLAPIEISSCGAVESMLVKLMVRWFIEEQNADGSRNLVQCDESANGLDESQPMLVVETCSNGIQAAAGRARRIIRPRRQFRSDIRDDSKMPTIYVSPYGGEGTASLSILWDKIALSDLEQYVVEALRIISPDITAVSMVGGGGRQARTAIVKASNLPHPVPLRSYGDGLNRLFGIVLSLVNVKDGILLIDEFENGMHHTVQLAAWRVIFKLAELLNIQVFATSHSWDCIEAFQQAASETPEEGVLVRLSRKDDDIIPTVFGEDELAIITRDRIEVR